MNEILSLDEARAEVLELRRIMCSREMVTAERWERLIESAFHLLLRVPESARTWVEATILEAEMRRDLWLSRKAED